MSNAVQGDMFAVEQEKKPKKEKVPYLREKPFLCSACGYYVRHRRHFTNMDWRETVEWQCMREGCKKIYHEVGNKQVPLEFRR